MSRGRSGAGHLVVQRLTWTLRSHPARLLQSCALDRNLGVHCVIVRLGLEVSYKRRSICCYAVSNQFSPLGPNPPLCEFPPDSCVSAAGTCSTRDINDVIWLNEPTPIPQMIRFGQSPSQGTLYLAGQFLLGQSLLPQLHPRSVCCADD
jgi:hypothetical protein